MGLRKISQYGQALFYALAGINHFINPGFYLGLIPDYLPFPSTINVISGLAEITLGIGILFSASRKFAGNLIIAMLIAFIPAHVYFIQIGSCVEGGLCIPEWVSWLRLVVIHPILMWWASSVKREIDPI